MWDMYVYHSSYEITSKKNPENRMHLRLKALYHFLLESFTVPKRIVHLETFFLST